jgi:pimeloyl-ACP methyl ester carboxylesterase
VTELVSTARGRFAVHAAGPAGGRPVVLVAGLGDDHASWDPILEYLAPAYRCITFDNRGIGASPVTPGPYRIADLAADAHALHQALGLAPCAAIGSSMGGAIGQEWALRYPGVVAGLVLSNSWGRTDAFTRVLFEHWISLGDARDLGSGRDALAGCAGLGLDQDAGDVGVLIQPVAGADAVVAVGDDQRVVVVAAQEQDRRQGLAR